MRAITVLFVVIIVGGLGAALLFTFAPDTRPAIVKGWVRKAKGYTPAKTPQEALDKFRQAIKERDYDTAALYCDDKYAEQLKRGDKKAQVLGKAVENLRNAMKIKEISSPPTELVLILLDPFPPNMKAINVKEIGNKASAQFVLEDAPKIGNDKLPEWVNKHSNVANAFLPSPLGGRAPWNGVVGLAKEGEGETASWKIQMPWDERIRLAVDTLREKGGNYKNSLNLVRDEVKNNPKTQSELEGELNVRLSEALGQ
jgi:hypothetical protein